jgi:hypothetical protein
MAKAPPLRTAARKPQAKAAKSGTRGAPERKTAPAQAPKSAVRTHAPALAAKSLAAKSVKAAVRQVALPAEPAVPPPLPAPIASFTF